MRRNHTIVAVVAMLSVFAAGHGVVSAQTYPAKAVRVLNGFPPGGATEVIGRIVCDHLTAALGKPFYLEAKPGAAGNLAGETLANAAPDGYTISVVAPAVIAVNPEMYKNMTFDPAKAFAPITLIARLPILLEVNSKHPPKTFQDFVAFAKSTRAPLNHGSAGVGTALHLAAELFKTNIGFASEHVAYRGQAPFAQAMMQRELDWAFDVPTTAQTLSNGGHVRLLAITAAERDARFPGVPTLTELGVPDSVWVTWFALAAPAGTPKAIIELIAREVAAGFTNPEIAARVRATGLDPVTTTPEETARIFVADRARWGKVVRDRNIVVE